MSRREREGAPHPVDLHVGRRVRAARQHAGISLTKLAGRVGVAFQQLQKYEAGANRISASMLFDIARALKVPVAAFYEGLGDAAGACRFDVTRAAQLHAVLASPGGPELLEAFLALPPPAQLHLAALVRLLCPQHDRAQPAEGARVEPA